MDLKKSTPSLLANKRHQLLMALFWVCWVLPHQPGVCEVYVAEWEGDLYGKELEVRDLREVSKDEMKKRGLRSPDLADAFCLTLAYNTIGTKDGWGGKLNYPDLGLA